MRKLLPLLLVLSMVGLLRIAPATADDRAPTAEELTRIEAALRDAGFTSWEEIELDDGHWEVDDARHSDGREYDLKLDPESLQIVSRDED